MRNGSLSGLILAMLCGADAAWAVGDKMYPLAIWFALCVPIALYTGMMKP